VLWKLNHNTMANTSQKIKVNMYSFTIKDFVMELEIGYKKIRNCREKQFLMVKII
jgi:hypothetical protein